MKRHSLSTFLGLIFGWSAYAYECYSCSNLMIGICSDPFDKSKSGNISRIKPDPHERCLKIKVGTTVRRHVVNATNCPSGKNACGQEEDDGVKSTICCCDSDLCNQASFLQQQIQLLFGALFAYGVFIHH
ncbi:hypothetical protein I4U23_013957 [Adineta vaga]|nr:hypothetical protein I4U23_013957 [Adineta vaga]